MKVIGWAALFLALYFGFARGTVPVNRRSCPPSWSEFQGHCYHYFCDRLLWSEGEEQCQQHGSAAGGVSHLVSISSEDENTFVYQMYHESLTFTPPDWQPGHVFDGFWLGLRQRTRNGPWLWSDGSSSIYTKWMEGEPNDYAGIEDCAIMWRKDSESNALQEWNDIECDNRRLAMPFMCEISFDENNCSGGDSPLA
ncbi:echinoidin-like [Diadema antillarum]|uniref:echinoidin-like n=1 Tax=Diadema antillarum TaxID=105358 RepID=UPI003A83ACD1